MIALDLPYGGRPSRRSFHAPGGVSALKSHNILIEPWQETSSFPYERGERLVRWTVSYEQDGVRFGQGTARTHPDARQAAEAFPPQRRTDLHWHPPASHPTRIPTTRPGPPRFLPLCVAPH